MHGDFWNPPQQKHTWKETFHDGWHCRHEVKLNLCFKWVRKTTLGHRRPNHTEKLPVKLPGGSFHLSLFCHWSQVGVPLVSMSCPNYPASREDHRPRCTGTLLENGSPAAVCTEAHKRIQTPNYLSRGVELQPKGAKYESARAHTDTHTHTPIHRTHRQSGPYVEGLWILPGH